MDITTFKQQNPEYSDIDDETLSQALYKKHYKDSGKSYEEFKAKFIPQQQSKASDLINPSSQVPQDSSELQDNNPVFDAVSKGASKAWDFTKNTVSNAIQDTGYSLGIADKSPEGLTHKNAGPGHTMEALEGNSPTPGPLSIRSLNPFLHVMYDQGGTPRHIADVSAGVIHDLSNIGSAVDTGVQGAKAIAGAASKTLMKLPGAAGALQEDAVNTLRGSVAKLPGSHAGWNEVNQITKMPDIPHTNVLKAIQDAKKELLKGSNPDNASVQYLANIEKNILDNGGKLPLDVMDADRRDLGAWGTQANGKVKGMIDKIYSGYHEDLEQASKQIATQGATKGSPTKVAEGAKKLQDAIEQSKYAFAKEQLGNMLEKKISPQRTSGLEQVNVTQLDKELRTTKRGKEIIKNLGSEYSDFKETLKQYQNVPALPPPKGANYGSGNYWMTAGAISGMAKLAGVDPISAASIGTSVASVPNMISRALMTEHGREFMRYAIKQNWIGKMPKGAVLTQGAEEAYRESRPTQND